MMDRDLAPLVPAAVVVAGTGAPLLVAVARTLEEQQQGLMFRESLGPLDGMLFVMPCAGLHAFWMEGVRMSLDIAWIGERGCVVDLVADVPACEAQPCPIYAPRQPGRLVLEVGAGVLAARGIRRGTPVRVEWP